MKGDAELAASAIGAEGINQSAYGITISAPGAASGGGEGGAAKAPESKMTRLGEVSADGKVTVASGGGGSAEITPENLVEKGLKAEAAAARTLKQEAAARSQQIFSAMGSSESWRAAAQPVARKSQSSGREM
ncbi:hypothetical protein NKY66_10840 [Sinorhizobium meliloti]|uniref:hypothetical protein n=1 Tax=Rhizobium meliloti TaxID=382 RepID=UPI003D661039